MPGDRVDVTVWVKPGSSKGTLVVPAEPGAAAGVGPERPPDFTVYLRERAVDGMANAALVRVLADYFGLAASAVSVLNGHGSRRKRVRIHR